MELVFAFKGPQIYHKMCNVQLYSTICVIAPLIFVKSCNITIYEVKCLEMS